MNKYNVLIIGAGKIAALYDKPSDENILTHAHAFSKHPGFNLIGFVDAYKNAAERAVSIWGGQSFTSVEQAIALEQIDVFCISVPDNLHYKFLKKVLNFSPKLVLAEKPLTSTVDEAEEIITLYKERNIPILVNYSRRFVPEFNAVASDISGRKFGQFIIGNGFYGKGILHNGSHMIDLLRYLVGPVEVLSTMGYEFDFTTEDPSVSAKLSLANGIFYLQNVNCKNYDIFELDLMFERGRIRITNSGFSISIYMVEENHLFKGHQTLVKRRCIDTSLDRAVYYTAENIYNNLSFDEPLKCSGRDGLVALEVCLDISKRALK